MIAIKGNREEKILDINKDDYLEMGYTIYDDKLKIVASPVNEDKKLETANAKIKELEDVVTEKDVKIKELEDVVTEKDVKIKELEDVVAKNNKNKDKNKSE